MSSIHNIGLFATQNIRCGQIIYSPSPNFDIKISKTEYKKLDKNSKWHIQHYGFYDRNENKWNLAFDNIRFCNHSRNPNIGLYRDKVVALEDIKNGQELLQNFLDFENPLRKELRRK